MCTCARVRIRTCTCARACTFGARACTRVHVCAHVCTCVHMHARGTRMCTDLHVCARVHVCICAHVRMCMRVSMYMCTYLRVYVCMHVHACVRVRECFVGSEWTRFLCGVYKYNKNIDNYHVLKRGEGYAKQNVFALKVLKKHLKI